MDGFWHHNNSATDSTLGENTNRPQTGRFSTQIQRKASSALSNQGRSRIAWLSGSSKKGSGTPVHVRFPSNGQSNLAYFEPAGRLAAWNQQVSSRRQSREYSSRYEIRKSDDDTFQSSTANSFNGNVQYPPVQLENSNAAGSSALQQIQPSSSPPKFDLVCLSRLQQLGSQNPPAKFFDSLAILGQQEKLHSQHDIAQWNSPQLATSQPASSQPTSTDPSAPKFSSPRNAIQLQQPNNTSHAPAMPNPKQVIPQKRPPSATSTPASMATTAPRTPLQALAAESEATDPLVLVKASSIHGLGVFALKFISPGDKIVSEAPICAINHSAPALQSPIASLATKLSKLAGYRTAKLSQLSSPESRPLTLESKFSTNAFTIERKAKPTGGAKAKSAVYPTISRVNHSCLPNAQFQGTWEKHQDDCTGTLRATTYILAGQEILLQYCPDPNWDELYVRRNRVEAAYGFRCRCAACSEPYNGRIDRTNRRMEIRDMKKSLVDGCGSKSDPGHWRDVSGKMCSTIEAELGGVTRPWAGLQYGLDFGLVHMDLPVAIDLRLAKAYREQATWNIKCGDYSRAWQLSQKAIRVDAMLLGYDDPDVEEQMKMGADLKVAAERMSRASDETSQAGEAEG